MSERFQNTIKNVVIREKNALKPRQMAIFLTFTPNVLVPV
jgi:hypothetical protein